MLDILSYISVKLHVDYFGVIYYKECIAVITPIDCVYCR